MIGIDIVSIKRIDDIYKKFGKVFLNKIFLDREIEEIETITNHRRRLEKIAGKFAVKEAVIKAFKNNIHFKDILVVNDDDGAPSCIVNKETVNISISHEKDYAVAIAMKIN